jgi:hypothetical protein
MRHEDGEAFRALLEDEFNFRKPKGRTIDAKLISDYWAALKDLPIELVKSGFARHRKIGRGFPIPADLRPRDERGNAKAGSADTQSSGKDHVRGYWRSIIVSDCRDALEIRFRSDGADILADLMRAHPQFGEGLRQLLDELAQQEVEGGRTDGMMRGCRRRCSEIARYYQHEARAEVKRRDAINLKPQRTAALPLSTEPQSSAGDLNG